MELFCKQKARVFMSSLLSPVLANIIMTEFERVIVEPLIGSGKIHVYVQQVQFIL